MTKQQWEQIEQLWQQALQIEPRQRIAFVTNQPDVAEEVRAEVLAMLRQEQNSADFLEAPALEEAAWQLAQDKLKAPTLEMKGQRLGAYEVVAELGAGGMGTVYLARDLHLNRNVAIKVLPEGFRHDADRLKRFQREAEMLAKVQHPNIATLFDYDRETSAAPRYLVMEYVAGETLDERLKRGALPATEAVLLFRQIAEALQAAHAQGVIHRDLKPSNIKITPDGTVKVLDFGLAKAAAQEMKLAEASTGSLIGQTTTPLTLTQPQMILGTPGYMSPEQVRGEKMLDQRTDWWAFGCMLYEALSGRNPFRAHTAADTQAAILEKEPDWKTLPAETPTALVRLIRQCLQKDAQRRLRTAREVLMWLGKVKPPAPLKKLVNQMRRHAPELVLAAAGLTLLISLFGAYQWLKPRPQTMLAVIAEEAVAPCQPEQSEAIAKIVNDKLRGVRGVRLVRTIASDRSQPFLMIDANLTQATLTAEATTILKVAAANCSGGQSLINYSLTYKDGTALTSGTANDLRQLLLSVVSALHLQGNAESWQTSESESEYYRAVALLEHYVNEQSVKDALAILQRLETTDKVNLARTKASLGWGYYLRYNLSGSSQDKEQAINYCDQALNLPNLSPEVLLMCGKVDVQLRKYDRAIGNFEKVIRQQSDNAEAILSLALAYEFKADPAKAKEAYLQAISLRPNYWAAHNDLGWFYFNQGDFTEAALSWTRVTELLPLNPTGYSNLGSALLYQGKYDDALKAYREALSLKKSVPVYQNIGIAYIFKGNCNEAVAQLRKGLEMDESARQDAELWGTLGDAYSCTPAQSKQAAAAYTQAISLAEKGVDSDSNYYLSLLAEWHARLGNKRLAIEKIEAAIQLEPDNFDCIISAIKVYKLTNQPEKLLIQFEKAIKNRKSLFEVEHDPLVNEIIQQQPHRTLIEQQKLQRG
jgi:serine/threonine protein kinase/tetratricopeptide (TPR) repeat protein